MWQDRGDLTLIDKDGVLLEPVRPDAIPDLPLVIGPGADRQMTGYQTLLAAAPALAQAPQAAPQAQDKDKGAKAQDKGAQGQGTPPAKETPAAEAPAKKAPPKKGDTAKAMVKDAQGKDVGEITLEQTAQGVLVRGTLSNLPPGCTFAPRCTFADEACRAQYPAYAEKRERHWAACWHSDKLPGAAHD